MSVRQSGAQSGVRPAATTGVGQQLPNIVNAMQAAHGLPTGTHQKIIYVMPSGQQAEIIHIQPNGNQGISTNNAGSNLNVKSDEIGEPPPSEDDDEAIDITINNVVCSFTTRCHLNLRQIATEAMHVEYKREQGMVNMKIRNPYTTASMWSSGKITITGATSEEASKMASRKFGRILEKIGFRIRLAKFRVVNVLGTCILPFGIKITKFSETHSEDASYEPELHPGVTYKIKIPKATLKIFSTGSITVTAPCVANVQSAIEHIYPLVLEFKTEKTKKAIERDIQRLARKNECVVRTYNSLDDFDDSSDMDDSELSDDEDFDSEDSQD